MEDKMKQIKETSVKVAVASGPEVDKRSIFVSNVSFMRHSMDSHASGGLHDQARGAHGSIRGVRQDQ